MDNLTHSLVGALIGQAGLKRKTGLAMPALIIGANLPDIDAACFFWLDGTEHLGFRRGITHGPPALVLLPLVLAGLLWGWDRWQAQRGKRPEGRLPVRFGWLYALSFIACMTHPALDWLNVYGIRLLEPFSSEWFYGDTLFIIDIWLWLGMGFATWFSLRREKRGGEWKRPARIAIAVGLAYIGLNFAISSHDRMANGTELQPGAEFISSPVPIAFWERQEILGRDRELWYVYSVAYPGASPTGSEEMPLRKCNWPDTDRLVQSNPDLAAFLFWSRAPFAEADPGGKGILISDARFYDRAIGAGFSVHLPDVPCEPVPAAEE